MAAKSNHTILEQNTLHGFSTNAIATKAYLFALDRLPESKAFDFACSLDGLGTVMDIAKKHGKKYHPGKYTDETHEDLSDFIITRAWYMLKTTFADRHGAICYK